MPELPDVEVFRRYLDATSLHQTIRSINLPDERILHNVSRQALAKRLDGRSLEQTRRHGKHLGAETLDSGEPPITVSRDSMVRISSRAGSCSTSA